MKCLLLDIGGWPRAPALGFAPAGARAFPIQLTLATPKMLSQHLHELEDCGMVHREVIPEKPPKTVYSLTTFGESVIPVLDAMCQWGANYLDGLDVQPPCCGAGA